MTKTAVIQSTVSKQKNVKVSEFLSVVTLQHNWITLLKTFIYIFIYTALFQLFPFSHVWVLMQKSALIHLMNNHVCTRHCPAAQGSIKSGSCWHNVTTEGSFKESLVCSVFNARPLQHLAWMDYKKGRAGSGPKCSKMITKRHLLNTKTGKTNRKWCKMTMQWCKRTTKTHEITIKKEDEKTRMQKTTNL